jgi:hypothetical protein
MRFRLVRLINKEIRRLRSAYALAREIEQKNKEAGREVRINHRALEKIAAEKPEVFLTVDFLWSLHVYFATRSESLQIKPIFEQPGIIEQLLESGRITLLMGTKPLHAPRLRDMSVWDARAMAELLSIAGRFEAPVRYRIREALLQPGMNNRAATRQQWFNVLRADRRSVVAFGAPVANLSAEVALARMCNVPAFRSPRAPFTPENRLPFYFAWPASAIVKNFSSAFALTWKELAQLGLPNAAKAAKAVRDGKARVFVWDDHIELVREEADHWKMYGVIVAQRRPGGNVWVVLCGLTGPATFAAAQLLSNIRTELPWPNGDYHPVLWAPVVAEVVATESPAEGGDVRELESCRFLQRPKVWPPPPKPSSSSPG